MTKGGSDDLRKCRAQRTARIGHLSYDFRFRARNIDGMAEFVNDSALLRDQKQQQEAEVFEQMSHSSKQAPLSTRVLTLAEIAGFCSEQGLVAKFVVNLRVDLLRIVVVQATESQTVIDQQVTVRGIEDRERCGKVPAE